jgi:hypothetical protein
VLGRSTHARTQLTVSEIQAHRKQMEDMIDLLRRKDEAMEVSSRICGYLL